MQNKNITDNVPIEILTPSGFQPFEGVARYKHDKKVKNFGIYTALDHRFIIDDKVVYAKDLNNDYEDCNEYFYDPVNVSNGKIYCHDKDLVSHNSFHGTGLTLISVGSLLALKAKEPEKILYNNALRIFERPIENHIYITTVDVSQGRGQDDSAFSIFDVTQRPFKQVVAYSDNLMSPILFPDVIVKVSQQYNESLVIIESNGPGQIVCNSTYYDYEYENIFCESITKTGGIGLTQTKKTKRMGVSNLKDLIEQEKLIVSDGKTIVQLSAFEQSGNSYQARDGMKDDLTMTLVIFAWFLSSTAFSDYDEIDMQKLLFENRLHVLDDELADFGFVIGGEPKYEEPKEYTDLKRDQEEWLNI